MPGWRWGVLPILAWAGWRMAGARRGRLQGRTVVVTGGSRGLGLLLARRFGAAGSTVAICARDGKELDAARRDLEGRGIRTVARRCDLTRPKQVKRFIEEVETEAGPVEVLVNNAGIIQMGPWSTMGPEDFEEVLKTNFLGMVYATWAALPGMVERERGRIVNITSIAGEVPVPHLLPYTTAKFAAVGFSDGLRAELAGTGVRVTTVVPGLMRTGSPANALFKGDRSKEFAWFSLGVALPISSMSADRAARRIVRAARRGEARVTLTWQAKLLRLGYHALPTVALTSLGTMKRLLPSDPRAEPSADESVRGMKLSHPLAPSPLTALTNRAARRNNAYGGKLEPSREHARKAGLT